MIQRFIAGKWQGRARLCPKPVLFLVWAATWYFQWCVRETWPQMAGCTGGDELLPGSLLLALLLGAFPLKACLSSSDPESSLPGSPAKRHPCVGHLNLEGSEWSSKEGAAEEGVGDEWRWGREEKVAARGLCLMTKMMRLMFLDLLINRFYKQLVQWVRGGEGVSEFIVE